MWCKSSYNCWNGTLDVTILVTYNNGVVFEMLGKEYHDSGND